MANPTDIKLIVFDVDGVLTDGSIVLDDRGVETKRFYVRDGFAIRAAMEMGLRVGVLTGRASIAVTHRMVELGIDLLLQGTRDKLYGLETLCQQAHLDPQQSAYVGDDLIDLPAMLRCGYPMAVADAVAEVRDEARYVTTLPGGRGAARDAIEHVLRAQGRWDELVERYAI
jgi:3-deoxy-D-manno-octulosonate 8-phosphate phosphatase (KDO 8-P phosphatase)